MGVNEHKVILDLCGGTGSFSAPYARNGYDVRIITYPEYDVRTYSPPSNVYGVIAAPPCTDFSVAGASLWGFKDASGATSDSLSIVYACLSIVDRVKPYFWVLENPVGRLPSFIGPYSFKCCFSEFGAPYQKKVCLWGRFVPPFRVFSGCEPGSVVPFDSSYKVLPPLPVGYVGAHSRRAARRSIIYPGFADAFFFANP